MSVFLLPSRVDPRSDAERAAYEKAVAAQRRRENERAMRLAWNLRRGVRVTQLEGANVFDRSLPIFLRRQAQ